MNPISICCSATGPDCSSLTKTLQLPSSLPSPLSSSFLPPPFSFPCLSTSCSPPLVPSSEISNKFHGHMWSKCFDLYCRPLSLQFLPILFFFSFFFFILLEYPQITSPKDAMCPALLFVPPEPLSAFLPCPDSQAGLQTVQQEPLHCPWVFPHTLPTVVNAVILSIGGDWFWDPLQIPQSADACLFYTMAITLTYYYPRNPCIASRRLTMHCKCCANRFNVVYRIMTKKKPIHVQFRCD